MCGIVGYLGNRMATEVLIEGLSKLEYRGYDSAGVAVNTGNELEIRKFKGRLAVLAEDLEKNPIQGGLGIGHTRWATHGEPSDVNSHPHFNMDRTIAVVHNGIIENYIELKEELQAEGVKFLSQTDTEVVAHLVDKYYEGNLLDAVYKTTQRLRGAYALGVICKDNNQELVSVRKDSPLVVGLGEGENFIASDIPAILKYTRKVYFLENGEFVHIVGDKVTVLNENREVVNKEVNEITWDVEAASKGGYEHFMLKEVYEQPSGVKETLVRRLNENGEIHLDDIKMTKEDLDNINRVYIVACGTAYHAGLIGKFAIEKFAKIPVITDIASEFRYRDPFIDDKTLLILVSQSGETADTLASLRYAKERGARILSVTNVVGSSIARESHDVFYTWAGPEISVASTKAYTTQLVSFYMIALDFAIKKGTITRECYNEMIEKLKEMPSKVEEALKQEDHIKEVAKTLKEKHSAFYLGRGLDYNIAMEGALKIKEISYIHAEAFAAGELKHGTIALIEKGTPVIAIASQGDLFEKMVSNMEEVKARGAYVIAVAQEKNKEVEKAADEVIYIPNVDDVLSSILTVLPLQLLSYYVAVERGCDVDKPRNLAKSVTVE
ncbi:glutamine--fructose-6-phosphate transaminase (isomerizing) [Paraclostridium sordellii]|uniref:Glutamine--fructose-6-phosphate aminotransferase [isomerizing] n=1 Tax=Paraclostridium sordellii TaxID=1505 RepID=A0A0C7QBV0_PARSO|nr:glutamine--fructose-6-phosphate transaminase (isomerizing) [Paeniclostridium sordellii]CEN80379.1 glucosamine--fructose-6-phosphate aminotransferase [[Clostridium] sordellii] [Paeniclostridium sordellii]CEP98292.1 glucosamine--fructose-6-phosphate aminotransferase [[Clostridium] sordellii] [Paeniclostridium sordellii]CEQ01766.1 glucosamine--fructose-6-phosphate aminotransferase [[Clostridium] sordellii] [Paeniclostridium sordellii]CEQ05211.1 glucosamine--fructose-6-phosphate aminotransferase